MAGYSAHVSWYDKCFGGAHDNGTGGACGDCTDSNNHVAWPNLSTTGCDFDCGVNLWRACGQGVRLDHRSYCSGGGVQNALAKDCCPCQPQGGCNVRPRCNGTTISSTIHQSRAADCTTALFIALGGDLLADGIIPVFASTL
jgi:hypothetical protein